MTKRPTPAGGKPWCEAPRIISVSIPPPQATATYAFQAYDAAQPHRTPDSIYPWVVRGREIVCRWAPGQEYPIPIAELRDGARAAEWYAHLAGKRWAQGIVLWGLRRAIDRYAR